MPRRLFVGAHVESLSSGRCPEGACPNPARLKAARRRGRRTDPSQSAAARDGRVVRLGMRCRPLQTDLCATMSYTLLEPLWTPR